KRGGLHRGVDAGLVREVQDLEASFAQLLAVGQGRPDQVVNACRASSLHERRTNGGLRLHLGRIPKLVTTKAPYAPSNTGRLLPMSRRSALTNSTPRFASDWAASLSGLRTATRARSRLPLSSASTTPPPCAPVPPSTAITWSAMFLLSFGRTSG